MVSRQLDLKGFALLCVTDADVKGPEGAATLSHEELEDIWRDNPACRATYRALASALEQKLGELGFVIKGPKDSTTLQHHDKLRTIPARPAYDV